MCGIAGIVARSDDDDFSPSLRQLADAIRHRGPDDEGICLHGRVGLTMRRLSIVDLAGGRQPLWTEDGRFALVGNGEIYNAPELRRELEARGHRLATGSDLEAALHLFEERGPASLERLNGMFAIAIYDRETARVFLARDRLGIKPLFLAETPRAIFFSSEVPGLRLLLDQEGCTPELDPDGLRDYLAHGYAAGTSTVWQGIRRLSPGAFQWVSASGVEPEKHWWQLPPIATDPSPFDDAKADTAAEEIAALLTDSVRLQTLGDVPAGAFLSGGLDSSTVVSLLSQSVDHAVPAFTLAIDDPDLDETRAAEATARHFGCEHHVETLSGVSGDELDDLFVRFGEPFADVSLLPTARVSKLAAQHVKFVLSGDGGDELFAGYSWLLREVQLRRWPRSLRYPARFLAPILRNGQHSERDDIWGKLLRTLGDLSSTPSRSFLRRRSLVTGRRRRSLVHPRFGEAAPTTLERFALRESSTSKTWPLLLDLDRRFYLGGDILEKVDRASMMHSLEARVPFLDHRIVEAAARIPVEMHLGPHGRGKEILRRAMQRILPAELFARPKRGFGLPVDRWFRESLHEVARDRLLAREFRELEILDPLRTEALIEMHRNGTTRHGHLLWALTSLATVLTRPPAVGSPSRVPRSVAAS